MIPAIHRNRWEDFLAQHPDRKEVIDQAMFAAFRHGWDNPGQTYEEQQRALMKIQMEIMAWSGWHGIPSNGAIPQVDGTLILDPSLFRF